MSILTLPFGWFHITVIRDADEPWEKPKLGAWASGCGRDWERYVSWGRLKLCLTTGMPTGSVQLVSRGQHGGTYILPLHWYHVIVDHDKTIPWGKRKFTDASQSYGPKERSVSWGRLSVYLTEGKPVAV